MVRKYYKIILISMILIIVGCSKNNLETIKPIFIDIDNTKIGSINDSFKNIDTIYLESTSECLISNVSNAMITDDIIFIWDRTVFFLFRERENFLIG